MGSLRVKERSELDPDTKIAWILEKDLLFKSEVHHEVFRLLELTYPNASLPVRSQLLERVCRGPIEEDAINLEERTRQYEIYNLLVWLYRVAPDCELAAQRFKEVQEAHSDDFAPRDHPDMTKWIYASFVQGASSPYSSDELLALTPWEVVEELLSYQGENSFGEADRSGLLNTVAEAVAQDYGWGRRLSLALEEEEVWDSDLWSSVLDGWREASLEEKQWEQILTFLLEHAELYGFADRVAQLMRLGVDKPQGELPTRHLPLAIRVAGGVWALCDEVTTGEELPTDTWSGNPMVLSAGRIVEFWIRSLSREHRQAGESWSGIPERYKDWFEKIIDGTSAAAQWSRTMLAGALHLLLTLDADWTKRTVLPLLDWSKDSVRAQQAWDGFLTWGRWSEDTLTDLLPLYEQASRHVPNELADSRDRFSEHIANIAVESSRNPVSDRWLTSFIAAVEPMDRKIWASHVRRFLHQLNEEQLSNIWFDWLSIYWAQRIKGIPAPLDTDELEEMIEWSVVLTPVFPEVVEKIISVTPLNLRRSSIYGDLAEKDYTREYPDASTKLLQHLLSGAQPLFFECKDVGRVFRDLVGRTNLNEELQEICNRLGELGCDNAAELNNLLKE